MKRLLFILMFLVVNLIYGQIPHKTRSTLQIDEFSAITHADSLLVIGDDKIVRIITYNDFVAQLEATGISGGGGSNPTDISVIHNPANVEIVSSTGTNGFINIATNINSGLLSPADKSKLDGLVNFDPSNYARKDIDETFAASIVATTGLHLGNQNNYGALYWYGGASGAIRASAIYDQATKDLIFLNYEAGGNYLFDGTIQLLDPVDPQDAVTKAYMTANLAGTTNSTAYTPTNDYHPATKKYVDDAVTAGGGYTDEAAQDAVGNILVDGTTINFTYDDATPLITAEVIENALTITESQISDFGSYVSLTGDNIFTGNNTFNEPIINDVTNTEITNAASNVLITKDWYNNNLYHTAGNITNVPSGNLIATDVQTALNELQTELDGVSIPNLNDQFAINSDYTTLVANQDMKGIISSGNITLYDGAANEISPEFQMTWFNSSASNITFSLGSGQTTKQFGAGAIPVLEPNQYAYAELIADDLWSIVIGGSPGEGSGITDHTELTSIGTNTHVQIDTHIADATIHYDQASISITESQISDLAHTVDTDTQLSQAQVGAYALAEGFVTGAHTIDTDTQLSQAEVGAYAAAEGYVAGPHTVNTDDQTAAEVSFDNTNIPAYTDATNVQEAVEDVIPSVISSTVTTMQALSGNYTGANTFTQATQVQGDPTIGDHVGNRDYNDGRYLQDANSDGLEYVRKDGAWVVNSGGAGGAGDVFKVGTPVNNQLGVWTGDGTIEGDTGLTWDGTTLNASSIQLSDFANLKFSSSANMYTGSGEVRLDLLNRNFSIKDNGTSIFNITRTTKVAYSYATNASIDAAGDNAVITKGYGDANYAPIGGSGLLNIVEDTTPQLGGDLDSNGFDIEMDNLKSIGRGNYGVNTANTSYMYFNNNDIFLKSHDSGTATDFGTIRFEYGNVSGLELRFVDDNYDPDFGSIVYDGFNDAFNISQVDEINLLDAQVLIEASAAAYPLMRVHNAASSGYQDASVLFESYSGNDVLIGKQQSSDEFVMQSQKSGADAWRMDADGMVTSKTGYLHKTVNTSITLTTTYIGSYIEHSSSTNHTYTIGNLAPELGNRIIISQTGTGQVTIVGSGATIRCKSTTPKTDGQYSTIELICIGTNEWLVRGEYEAN